MAGLIKRSDTEGQAAIQRLGAARPATTVPAKVMRDPSAEAIEALQREVATQAAAIADMEARAERLAEEATRAFERGKAEGRLSGLREAERSQDEAVEALRDGITQALERVDTSVGELNRFALAIATQSLEKVFGEKSSSAQLVEQALRHQFAALDAATVLQVKVSPADFPGAEALGTLAESLGRPGLTLAPDPTLAAGDCQIVLKLGVLEIGPRHQWKVLKEALDLLGETGSVSS